MNLSGHRELTSRAVKEFLYEVGQPRRRSAAQQLRSPLGLGPSHYAVKRDVIDFMNLTHFFNCGQNSHFMRRKDDQSPYQAYTSACDWIHTNGRDFARSLVRGDSQLHLQQLGDACHTVEDSFSKGHVTRSGLGPGLPGEITYVKAFSGADRDGHIGHDDEWDDKPWAFELPKTAVKALLWLIFDEAEHAQESGTGRIDHLRGWTHYRDRWLKPSPRLATYGGHEIDLIQVHTNGFSLNERGLAHSLYAELGEKSTKVARVFKRLAKHDDNSADDVAEHYVNRLRQNRSSPVTSAVARNRDLVKLLIRVLDEGWTTSGQRECMTFLQGLR
jgi:hypothetical protein